MTPYEMLEALKAGEYWKLLHNLMKSSKAYSRSYHFMLEQDKANAAKVEVTKVVLDDTLSAIEYYITRLQMIAEGKPVSDYTEARAGYEEALTLLKTLREQL